MRATFLCSVLCLSLLAYLIAPPNCHADPREFDQPGVDTFQVEKIADGLGVVWAMAFLNDSEIIYTEREGRIGILNLESGEKRNVTGVPPIKAERQGGLLDIAVPDHYQQGDWLYVTYSKYEDDIGQTALARITLDDYSIVVWEDLLVAKSSSSEDIHFGSRIAFDQQGHIFFTVGDRGYRRNAQNLKNHAGCVLRINIDGSIPEDNPFYDNPDALAEIWSYGHRNPQGIFFDSDENNLWIIEHGPRGGDEINLIKKGGNYGWPVVSHGKEYWGPVQVGEGTHKEGMVDPVKVYIPSIAPSSMLVYKGNAFPEWRNSLLAGALKLQHVNIVYLGQSDKPIKEKRVLMELGERIRSLLESSEGWIYFSTDSGKIYRLRPL